MTLLSRELVRVLRGVAPILLLTVGGVAWASDGETAAGRDPKQAVDDGYTAKMRKYTTAPYFT